MPAKRIPQLTAISGASTANDDNLVIFDTDANETKRILRSQLAAGLVGDLPYTPSGGISATTVPTAIAELDSEAAKSAALAASGGSALVGFLQAGTGAVTRTAQSKLRDVVSVRDFGIAGNELVSSLLLMWPGEDGVIFNAQGYHLVNDEGGGEFVWDASSTATHDGGSVIKPTANSGAGRWLRVFPEDGVITYEMWGARKLTSLTDTTDSLAAINAANSFLARPSAVSANWKIPRSVRITGMFGVSDTVNFILLHGITFEGVNTFSYQSAGFKWVAAASSAKSMCYVAQCRQSTWKNIRGIAPFAASTSNVLNAMFDLDGTVSGPLGSSIQERLLFSNIMVGVRDGYEDSIITPNTYQFRYMFKTSGTNTNNDFHTFEYLRCENVEYGIVQSLTQAVQWEIRDSRFHYCDYIGSSIGGKIYFRRCEGNYIAKACFVLNGTPGTDFGDIVIDSFVSEATIGAFLTSTTGADILVRDSILDTNSNNVTYPYCIDIRSNNLVTLNMNNVRGVNNSTNIAVGATSAARQIVLNDCSDFTLDYTGSSSAQRIYIEKKFNPNRSTGLTDNRYRPSANLLSSVSDSSYDTDRYDIPQPKVRVGNRFVGGTSTIRHVTYDSGTISSGATYTFAAAIPADCILLGVTAHNNNGFPAISGYQVGVSGTAAKFGTKTPASDNVTTAVNAISGYSGTGPEYSKTAQDVILTATGANFAGGRCVLTVHYITLDGRFRNPDFAV